MKLYRKNRKLNNSGFSLVEVLVAIVILAIISLPVLSTFSNAARINNKARRTENANTAINNIIEEAKSMSLDRLAGGNGQYTYQQLGGIDSTTYSVGNKKDASNILYYEGVNKEKFYIKAEFDPSPYTTPADSTVKDNPNNNINSAGISVYADVSADSSLVYRDDNSDNQAVAHFKYYTGEQAFDRSKITKSTSIDTVLSYPDYVKTTTLTTNTFEAEEREEDVSGTKQTVYYVSGKIKKNIKNLYVFYTPFDDYISTNKKGTTTTDGTMEVYVNDKINVTYKYPAELTNVRYSDLNVYLLEQEKITQEKNADGSVASAQKYRMLVDHNKVKVTFNTQIMGNLADKAGNKDTAARIYSNIKDWKSGSSSKTEDSMYRLTVTVYYNDSTMSDDSKIATMTSTKIN